MVVSWYTADLYTGTSLSYKIEGVAPFRVLTVQQLDARVVTDFSGKTMDVQVKFYETTNEVKVIYNNTSGFGGAGIAEVDGQRGRLANPKQTKRQCQRADGDVGTVRNHAGTGQGDIDGRVSRIVARDRQVAAGGAGISGRKADVNLGRTAGGDVQRQGRRAGQAERGGAGHGERSDAQSGIAGISNGGGKHGGGVAVINVAAAPEAAPKAKKARAEDALHAPRAPVPAGIVLGRAVALVSGV